LLKNKGKTYYIEAKEKLEKENAKKTKKAEHNHVLNILSRGKR
jgi:hypothetical protein